MKIIFKELEMRNFLSYGSNRTKIKLDFNKPILVVGRNYDSVIDGQIDSNGAGKTTILNGIATCLYNRTIPSIDLDDQINYINGKNMEVSLVFSVDKVNYKIVRYRKNKALGGNGVKLYINDKDFDFTEDHDKTPDSIENTNKEIIKIIGFPFDIFSRIVVFSATFEPFLNLPSSHASKANQRDVIEELFGLTELTRKAESLKEIISTTKKDISTLRSRNDMIDGERSRINTQIASNAIKINDWDSEHKIKIQNLSNELRPLYKIDVDTIIEMMKEIEVLTSTEATIRSGITRLSTDINALKNENVRFYEWNSRTEEQIKTLTRDIDKYSHLDFDMLIDVANEIELIRRDLSTQTTQLRSLREKYNQISSSIDNKGLEIVTLKSNTCPYCSQEMHDVAHKLSECEQFILVEQDKLDAITVDIRTSESSIKETTRNLEKLESIDIPANIKTLQQNVISWKSTLSNISNSVNPYTLIDTETSEQQLIAMENEADSIKTIISNKQSEVEKLLPPSFGVVSLATVAQITERIDNIAAQLERLADEKNPFKSVADDLNDMLSNAPKPDVKLLDQLAVDLEHQEFLLKLLTKKDSFIRKALLNKNIPFLNSRLDGYLKILGLPHAVLFTEDMSVKISQFGTSYRHTSLSNGQKARINLALSFAFRDVLQSRFSKINLCILDECLDVSLGNVGVQMATKMIKKIAKDDGLSMFVISHKDEIAAMFNDKIEIELREGFSNILDSSISETEE